jgi:hypothetical protein
MGFKVAVALVVSWAVGGCAASLQRGSPLADPAAVAARARESSGAERPSWVRFEWEYADKRGNLMGDGVSRVNPPDSFRLDLFTTGEGSMIAVLVDDRLETLGQIEDVELPAPVFLYAMAGIFRPGNTLPTAGFESDGAEVLEYPAPDGGTRYFFFREGRLVRLEERRGNRLERRIEIEWGPDPAWPSDARYRDDLTPNRVRWELVEVRVRDTRWPAEDYVLDSPP